MRDTENRNTVKCKTDKIRKMTEVKKVCCSTGLTAHWLYLYGHIL